MDKQNTGTGLMSGGRENQNRPSFEDVISTLFRRFACEEVQTAHPGKIIEYNAQTQEADIELFVTRNYIDGTNIDMPIVSSVPVMQYRTSSAMVKLPINEGDGVLVIFSKSSLDSFLATGSRATYSAGRQFVLSDAIALPGLFPFSDPNTTENDNDLEIINNSQKITIKENGDIEIGGSNLRKLITETAKDIFNNHGHDYVAGRDTLITGTPVAGVPPVTTPTPILDSDLTTKTKAE